jgi:hypothetical protein
MKNSNSKSQSCIKTSCVFEKIAKKTQAAPRKDYQDGQGNCLSKHVLNVNKSAAIMTSQMK